MIPGGIYGSKAPGFLVPGAYPCYIESAKGCRMVDADGNEFIDYLCGYGSQIVGYGNERVDGPALERASRGDLLDQPAPVMVDLAERLVRTVEGSSWAVFMKNGTDATTLAYSLARVHTEKPIAIMAIGRVSRGGQLVQRQSRSPPWPRTARACSHSATTTSKAS